MAKIEEWVETPPPKPKKKGPPPAIRNYLVVYNAISALGWGYVLLSTTLHLLNLYSPSSYASLLANSGTSVHPHIGPDSWAMRYLPTSMAPLVWRACTTYARVGWTTTLVQSLAILEVVHALFGWVRSPVGTTAMQVASRYYLVWGVTCVFHQTRTNPLYATMVLSWSFTEVIRYVFYACNLLGSEPSFLLWLRYTTFYLLYPTGASSEAFLIKATLPATSISAWGAQDLIRGVLFVIWWPGLYVMYTYMIKQRRKVLGKGSPKAKTL